MIARVFGFSAAEINNFTAAKLERWTSRVDLLVDEAPGLLGLHLPTDS